MKYEVGQKLKATQDRWFSGDRVFIECNEYEISDIGGGAVRFIDETKQLYAVLLEDMPKFFIETHKPKHTIEQQAYLDKCAIAAMQGMIIRDGLYSSSNPIGCIPQETSKTALDFAEAMLAERERRAKQ